MAEKLFKSNTHESPDVYNSSAVEKLIRCHHSVPFFIFIPVIAFFLYRAVFVVGAAWWAIVLLWLLAIAFWSALEYFIHRYILHLKPKGKGFQQMMYAFHGAHHDYPNDKSRVVLSPVVTIPGGIGFYFLSHLVFGAAYGDAFFSGLVFAYLLYDLNHYAAHHLNWNFKWFKVMKKHHLKHHFKDPHKGYGFTTTAWDQLFDTDFEKESSKKKVNNPGR